MINQKYSVIQQDHRQPRCNARLHSTAKCNFKKASIFKIYPTCNYFELNTLVGLNVVLVDSYIVSCRPFFSLVSISALVRTTRALLGKLIALEFVAQLV